MLLKLKLSYLNLQEKATCKVKLRTNSVKYLEIKVDEHLTWKPHIDKISAKLNIANANLIKIRRYSNQKIFWKFCYIQFTFIFFFFGLGTEFQFYKKTLFLKKNAPANPRFNNCNIVKFHDKIALENSTYCNIVKFHDKIALENSTWELKSVKKGICPII